jgi:hypothetical protein
MRDELETRITTLKDQVLAMTQDKDRADEQDPTTIDDTYVPLWTFSRTVTDSV